MDTAVPTTATQLAIIWPLLGFLLIWMILFAVLAFRPDPAQRNAPAGITLTPGNGHTSSVPATLQTLVAQSSPTGTITPMNPASIASAPDSTNGTGTSNTII
ncbi:MAG TPA: hypothetical protein VKV40_14300 [Ktedonobacteraceae bacterium]|nr:hypothetical protein [Ktedonobacteraceae bacterium]